MMIQIQDIIHKYDEKESNGAVLNDVSYNFEQKRMYCIMGPSGSGKSTLLNIIGGLIKPTEGSVLYDGEDITTYNENDLAELRMDRIGYIFQSYNLIPFLTVKENILLQLRIAKRSVDKYIEIYNHLLDELNIKKIENDYVANLSGGEQQRVAIARCFLMQPQVILADEPTGSLDAKRTEVIMNLLKRITLESDVTVIIVTHDPKVSSYCDESIYLENGNIERR